jgi:hypothetical protein
LACVASDAFPSLTEFVAVADVHPPRWRITGASERLPLALLPAAPPVEQVTALLATTSQPDASRTLHELGVRRSVAADPLFAGTWHVNHLGQVLFPYSDAKRVVGLQGEMAGRQASSAGDWADETLGATHGIWHSRPTATDTQLVVTTRAIDALSYHQLRPGFSRRYLAVSPMPSKEQSMLLARAIAQMTRGSSLVAACSNSLPAEYLVALLRRMTKAAGLPMFQDSPVAPPDRWEAPGWNDVLRSSQR